MKRRTFLTGLAVMPWAAHLAAAHQGKTERSIFPRVDPSEVDVDLDRLATLTGFLATEYEQGSFPGALVAAIRGGKCFLGQCWGTYCSLKRRDNPLDLDVRHMVWSFSKIVSATVVVQAHQDGLVDYDVPLTEYIPEFQGGGKDAITLRHLLAHSAGIPDAPGAKPVSTQAEWQKAVAAVCAAQTEWTPGSRTQYHAFTGMLMAAEAVRRASGGASWEDICRRRLFEPIGAPEMTFRPSADGPPVAVTPQPQELPFILDSQHFSVLAHPAAGVIARPEDMLRLLQLHLNRGKWDGNRLISERAFEEMHRVQYADDIQAALEEGNPPAHEYWTLGLLTRGTTSTGWFGFGSAASPQAFGHAGINTVIGIADPERDTAWVFLTTDSPKSDSETIRLRNTVSDLLIASIK